MKLSQFKINIPQELIAIYPPEERCCPFDGFRQKNKDY